MPQIKLPVSEQFDRVILADDQFTVTQSGIHIFGATVGRSHQQILDIRGYQSLIITVSSSLGLTSRGNIYILLFDENGRLTGGTDATQDPAVVDQYELPLIEPGTVTIGESYDNRIDTSGAVGAVVLFYTADVGADLQVKVMGERNNKQLEAIQKTQEAILKTQGSALLASGEINVSVAGIRHFGETFGSTGWQELLDVSAYNYLTVTVDAEGVSSSTRISVLLYDKANMVPAGRDASSEPAFIKLVGDFTLENGIRNVYRFNVAGAQGADVEFRNLPVGATLNVRVAGSQAEAEAEVEVDYSIEKINVVTLVHADLFDEDDKALMKTINWGTEGRYSRILFYVTSSFPVPVTVRCLEIEGGIAKMVKWDGEAFSNPIGGDSYDTVTLPAVLNNMGVKTVAKFPIHHALRLLQDGAYSLQTRVIANDVSDATDPQGNPYELILTILGVK